MRRQILALGTLAFVMALIMAVGATAQAEMEQYESEVILSLPWGSGPNEIGYAKEGPEDAEGLRYGPTAIDVDQDGNIYIYDMVNSRVKVFDQKGNLLKNFGVRATSSNICVDTQKAVWVVDTMKPELHKYAPDGTLVETIQYEPLRREGISFLPSKIECRGGKIYLNEFELQLRKVEGKDRKGENIRKATLTQIGGHRWGITRSGRHYRVESTSDLIKTFVVTDENDRILGNISIEQRHPYDDIAFLSEDRTGNMYLLFATHTNDRDFYEEIRKYDRSYNLIAKIGPLLRTFYTARCRIEKGLVLDEEGSVYQLITEKEGVKIVKWSRK